jgi:hypothetical protein
VGRVPGAAGGVVDLVACCAVSTALRLEWRHGFEWHRLTCRAAVAGRLQRVLNGVRQFDWATALKTVPGV